MSARRDEEGAAGDRRWLLISAGHGPAECAWAVARLAPRVAAAATAAGLAWRELDRTPGSAPETAASVLLEIEDMSEGTDRIDAFVDAWRGTILWVGKSPLRPHHRRRNWYVKVTAIAAAAPAVAATIREGECEITAMRSGGAGGQHVNKRSTALRVLHRPSGIEVVAREERSQHHNRRLAFERIAAILAGRAAAAGAAADRARWGEHQEIERGNPRRIFRGPDLVADDRDEGR